MNSNEHQKISMKSYTDIGQSRKLAEFLPIESADMYYEYVLPRSNKLKHIPSIGNPVEALEWYNKGYTHFSKEPLSLKEYCIPCWSLAALLGVIKPINENAYTVRGTLDGGATISFDEATSVMYQEKEIIDAVFEMVVWLKEIGKL